MKNLRVMLLLLALCEVSVAQRILTVDGGDKASLLAALRQGSTASEPVTVVSGGDFSWEDGDVIEVSGDLTLVGRRGHPLMIRARGAMFTINPDAKFTLGNAAGSSGLRRSFRLSLRRIPFLSTHVGPA